MKPELEIIAGNGNGCMSFRRKKIYRKMADQMAMMAVKAVPVIMIADNNLNTLVDYRFVKRYAAKKW